MNKQQFLDLGLTEEQATKAEAESKKELETYIPKTRFNEVNDAKKQLETDIRERDKQLEDIKKSSGDNEILKNQIETLQADNKAAKEKYEDDLKELQVSNAIKLAITDKAQDAELVSGLFDRKKLILGEDGKITGLDEQLKNLQESKPFLFKAEDQKQTKETTFKGLKPGESNNNTLPDPNKQQPGTFSMKNAIAARLQPQLENNN